MLCQSVRDFVGLFNWRGLCLPQIWTGSAVVLCISFVIALLLAVVVVSGRV
jgi:hypothetical protein